MSSLKKEEGSEKSSPSPEVTTTMVEVNTHAGHHASALARRIHGWSWQAVCSRLFYSF